jgi:hypothetical protein
MNVKVALAATTLALTLTHASSALAQYVVQIAVDSVLDGRSVSTLTSGAVVPWVTGQGVYADGCCFGYVTAAVKAKLAPNAAGRGLPDDGLFPAISPLPPFQLHFSNAAPATSMQTRQVHQMTGPQSFQFAVPPATYSALYLILTASEGAANVTLTLSYSGGAPSTTANIVLPDSGTGVQTAGSAHFYLITDTGKWSSTDTDAEPTAHTIEGIKITPSTTAMLTGVQVTKTNAAHLVFWGATGITTTSVGTQGPLDSGLTEGGTSDAGDDSGAGGSSDISSGTGDDSGTRGSSSSGSGGSTGTRDDGGAGGNGSSSSSGSTEADAGRSGVSPTSGSDGGGCSAVRGSTSEWGIGALALGCLLAASRRRRQRSIRSIFLSSDTA